MRSQQDGNLDLGHHLSPATREARARRPGTTLPDRSGEIRGLSPTERQSPLPTVPCVISRVPGTVYVSRSLTRDQPPATPESDAPRTRRR